MLSSFWVGLRSIFLVIDRVRADTLYLADSIIARAISRVGYLVTPTLTSVSVSAKFDITLDL